MTAGARSAPSGRRGMILPLVLVGMLLMLTFSASLQHVAWRAWRGARATWEAQHGLYLADAAIVEALAEWTPDSIASAPIGAPLVRISTPSEGWRVRRSIVRSAPLTAVVHAVASRSWSTMLPASAVPANAGGDATRVRRAVTRVVRLEPPALPVRAAATLLGPATLESPFTDGRDQPGPSDPRRDDCGPLRDSGSVDAIAAARFVMRGIPTLLGATTTIAAADLARANARFDSAFTLLRARATTVTPSAVGSVPTLPDWHAAVIPTAGSVTLDGQSTHIGLLAVDGDLTIHGALHLVGLLVVRGALNASAGTLHVRGALVVRDASARGSTLGAGTRLEYAPCVAGRALAAVAVPRASPFGAWNSP
jgi:hypothetical protein